MIDYKLIIKGASQLIGGIILGQTAEYLYNKIYWYIWYKRNFDEYTVKVEDLVPKQEIVIKKDECIYEDCIYNNIRKLIVIKCVICKENTEDKEIWLYVKPNFANDGDSFNWTPKLEYIEDINMKRITVDNCDIDECLSNIDIHEEESCSRYYEAVIRYLVDIHNIKIGS